MKFQYRKKCVITEKKDLEHLHTIKNLAIYIGCTNKSQKKDIKEDMEVYISRSSGVIQLRKLLPLDVVYFEYHSEAVGKVWKKHFQEFSKFILKNNKSKKIIEIGGSNGHLAQVCLNLDKNLKWTIIEPNPEKKKFKDKNINIVKSFIENKLDILSKDTTLVHSHTLEHFYNPLDFFKSVSKRSNPGDMMIFSIPDLFKSLKKKHVNTLNFEHTYFITEEVADFLIKKSGYKIIDKKYFEEHSIFYAIKFTGVNKFIQKNNFLNKYSKYRKMYIDFIKNVEAEVLRINKLINQFKNKNPESKIYLFGAHIFSQFLISKGLKTDKINAILDNSLMKNGKRLYGTNLHVISPNDIKDKSSLIILKAGQYQGELKKQFNKISKKFRYIN